MKDYAASAAAEHDDLNLWHRVALSSVVFHGKRVLDVGAGTGLFLDAARKEGATNVFAVDPNPNHAGYFQSRDIPYSIGYLSRDLNFKPDIVTCFEVIEHVYDPHPILSVAAELLKPCRGTLVISTPNAFNARRAAKFLFHQRHHDPLMDPVISPDAQHIRAYSFGMVRDLLAAHGFSGIRALGAGLLPRYLSHGIVMAAEIG